MRTNRTKARSEGESFYGVNAFDFTRILYALNSSFDLALPFWYCEAIASPFS